MILGNKIEKKEFLEDGFLRSVGWAVEELKSNVLPPKFNPASETNSTFGCELKYSFDKTVSIIPDHCGIDKLVLTSKCWYSVTSLSWLDISSVIISWKADETVVK